MHNNKVIVFGNDHTNTTGIVQCLGREGFNVSVAVWGLKNGIVSSSNYVDQFLSAASPDECINLICELFDGQEASIIACCDAAAIALEKNRKRLGKSFSFEYTTGNWTIEELCEKDRQVKLAQEAGFNVPWSSSSINCIEKIPDDVPFPCIAKSLVSCRGSKNDLTIIKNERVLYSVIERLLDHTPELLLQQYIERDYEISILGCGLKNGECIIPCVENKLTLYPKNVGLECLANMQPLEDESIIRPIRALIKRLGYVGLFSVEMMHCKNDGKFYFTEINLRNDGANSFVYKYGVNLPLNHVEDLLGLPITEFTTFKPGYYIWEMHHSLSLVHREIRFRQWLRELRMSKGFLLYFPDDKRPFYKQYSNWFLGALHLRKNEPYK